MTRRLLTTMVLALAVGAAVAWCADASDDTGAPPSAGDGRSDGSARTDDPERRDAAALPPLRCAPAQHDARLAASTAAPPAAAARDADPEWELLPRSERLAVPDDIHGCTPFAFPIDELFRHPRLNPLDSYIPKRERDNLRVVLAGKLQRLGAARMLYLEEITAHVNRRIALGTIQPLEYADNSFSRAARARGRTDLRPDRRLYEDGDTIDVFVGGGQQLYGFRQREAPELLPLLDGLDALRVDLAQYVGTWFQRWGSMSPADSHAFFAALQALPRGVRCER